MTANITRNDCILFIYNELSEKRSELLAQELSQNEDLLDELVELQLSKDNLDLLKANPSETSIEIIIEASREMSGSLQY
jgi:hypothetical protein